MIHEEPIKRYFMLTSGVDPLLTMAALWQGPSDPQMRLESDSASRAMRTRKGPASVSISRRKGGVLARAWGPGAEAALEMEVAPGPLGLRLPPPPETLAGLPYWAFHPLGVERRRADTIRAAATVAPQLEAISRLTPEEGKRRLLSLPGVGEWTAAETMRLALGDPDAVSVGDFHLPRLICGALANETSATDERMLELLEPYRGQRARVALLIEHGSPHRPRRAPRMPIRSIAAI